MNKRFKTCHKRKLKRIVEINNEMKGKALISCHSFISECSIFVNGDDDSFIGSTVKSCGCLGAACK